DGSRRAGQLLVEALGRSSLRSDRASSALFQLGQDELGDFAQRFENPLALDCDRFHDGLALLLKLLRQCLDRHGVRQVSRVELKNVRNRREVQVVFLQVLLKVLHSLEIGVEAFLLRISNKDNTISAFEDELAAGFVKDLAGHGVEMEAGLEATHRSQIQ